MHGSDDVHRVLAAAPAQLTQIEADLGGLADFRSFISHELDANLRPGAQSISRDHSQGVGFGWRNAGHQVQAARERYHEMLAASTANLAAYVDAAEIMIEAMRHVITNYHDSDAMSAAGSDAINSELIAAITSAQQARRDATEAARIRDWRHGVSRAEQAIPL